MGKVKVCCNGEVTLSIYHIGKWKVQNLSFVNTPKEIIEGGYVFKIICVDLRSSLIQCIKIGDIESIGVNNLKEFINSSSRLILP